MVLVSKERICFCWECLVWVRVINVETHAAPCRMANILILIDTTIVYCFDNTRAGNMSTYIVRQNRLSNVSIDAKNCESQAHSCMKPAASKGSYHNGIVARSPSDNFGRVLDFREFQLISWCNTAKSYRSPCCSNTVESRHPLT